MSAARVPVISRVGGNLASTAGWLPGPRLPLLDRLLAQIAGRRQLERGHADAALRGENRPGAFLSTHRADPADPARDRGDTPQNPLHPGSPPDDRPISPLA